MPPAYFTALGNKHSLFLHDPDPGDRLMKIALAQINPTVGDIAGNADKISRCIARARAQDATLVVFPELAIIGYPPKDLLLKPAVINQCVQAIHALAASCTDIAALIGYPCPSDEDQGRSLYNAAALCHGGRVAHRFVKTLLPTYDVFDERRYFEPGTQPQVATLDGVRIGVSICEDLWNDAELLPRRLYHEDPIQALAKDGAQVLINCSASPFVIGKHAFRLQLLGAAAKRHQLPIVFCNQFGGNDELVFDGNSCVLAADAGVLGHAKDFESDLLVVDVPMGQEQATPGQRVETAQEGIASAYHALVLGLGDYCRKCGFKSIVLGLSGGIDSALCAALAAAALGAENVIGVAMPSRYSSEGSLADARELAERLKIRFSTVPINDAHEAFERMLGPHLEGLPADATEENVQARTRGVILMALSNKLGAMLVSTGNKSELAVGYCTLYGDMAGGLAVLSDVPKTLVYELAKWINDSPDSPLRKHHNGSVIPESSITKPPSAELRPDQTDQDSLPPYDVLDQIIERYVEQEQSTGQIIEAMPAAGADTIRRIVRLIDLNEYKRKQAAPGLKITGRAFGFGRRMPIAQRYEHDQRDL